MGASLDTTHVSHALICLKLINKPAESNLNEAKKNLNQANENRKRKKTYFNPISAIQKQP